MPANPHFTGQSIMKLFGLPEEALQTYKLNPGWKLFCLRRPYYSICIPTDQNLAYDRRAPEKLRFNFQCNSFPSYDDDNVEIRISYEESQGYSLEISAGEPDSILQKQSNYNKLTFPELMEALQKETNEGILAKEGFNATLKKLLELEAT